MPRRRPIAEINVVPYIDVMLVLLIIFMITAPLLQLGVDVNLPQADAENLQPESEPVLIGIRKDGTIELALGEDREQITLEALTEKVAAFSRRNPEVPVLIGGDSEVAYERVYRVLASLQRADVTKVGLIGDPIEAR